MAATLRHLNSLRLHPAVKHGQSRNLSLGVYRSFVEDRFSFVANLARNFTNRLNINLYLTKKLRVDERFYKYFASLSRHFKFMGSNRFLMSGACVGGVGSSCVSASDLKDGEGHSILSHIGGAHTLITNSLCCPRCGLRLRIDGEVKGVTYCHCKDAPRSVYLVEGDNCDGWRPFLEREDIIVWRREHKSLKGMYEYKMYGNFDDVCLEEFIDVQADLSDFRFTWDKSTKKCDVVEKIGGVNDELIYHWEVMWPRFFSNREYCCHRSIVEDPDTEMRIMLTRGTDHPGCVKNRSAVRVEDYESMLVVKAHSSPSNLGMEFVLTGFENPGLKLPEAIVTLVAVRLMPEFMINLRKTCIKLRKEREATSSSGASVSARESIVEENSFQPSLSRERAYA